MKNKNFILTTHVFLTKLSQYFIKNVSNIFFIIYIYIQILSKCFKFFFTLCFYIVNNVFFILLDCLEDLKLFFIFLMNDFFYPLYLRRKENRQAKLNYRAHRDYMRKEKRDREIALQSRFERLCHKVVDIFFKVVTLGAFSFTLTIWYYVWEYTHNDKQNVEIKLSPEEIDKLNVSPAPLFQPRIDPDIKPPVEIPADENIIDALIRLFKTFFIINYAEETFTGEDTIIIIRKEDYEKLVAVLRYEEEERQKQKPKTNPDKKKALLDDFSSLDMSVLYSFLFPCLLLAKLDISFDYLIYFNLDFIFRDVIHYIC